MAKDEYLFQKKMNYIYKKMCQEDLDKFTRYFYIEGGKAKLVHRQTYLKKYWLDNPCNSKMFSNDYKKYPFGGLEMEGRQLFKNANEFLSISLNDFKERIDEYALYHRELMVEDEIKYRYLYLFNIDSMEESGVNFYTINYSLLESGEIELEVYPPKSREKKMNVRPYHGSIRHQKSRLILSFSNKDDYISAIFNTELLSSRSKYLVGVGIGIADFNQKIPLAKKVILSKERVKNFDELYLTLNETERVVADENSYKFRPKDEKEYLFNHLHKYTDKISHLNILFKKLIKRDYFNSTYLTLAFKELGSISKIFNKINRKNSYFVYSRKRVLDTIISSYDYENFQKIYMVMPTFDDNIFEYESDKILELQERLIALSQEVEIEIIFVIEDCKKELNYEFKAFLAKVLPTISILFSYKKNIEQEVNSIDFIYTDKKNFIATKSLRTYSPSFHIYSDRGTVDAHEIVYRKIRNRSITQKEFLEKEVNICKPYNPILKRLVGRWYFHLYGTHKLWVGELNISENGWVKSLSEDGVKAEGEIIHKTHQSVILLEDKETQRILTITFDHQPYKIAHAFTVQVTGKQFRSDLEILSMGLLSRHHIEIEKFQEIFGDVDDVRVLERDTIQHRLREYLEERFSI